MSNSFYPVVAGRVSDSLNRTRSLSQLQYDQIALNKLQTQIASGQRFTRPSDDPGSAIRVLALQRLQENQGQRLVNLKSAENYLGTSEIALAETNDLVNNAKSILLEAANTVTSDSDRQALVFQLDNQIDRLISLGNRQYQDRYLFAGGLVRVAPFTTTTNDGILFNGDSLTLNTIGDQDSLIGHSISSEQAFGVSSQGVIGLTDLAPLATLQTKLENLNNGQGITKGAIQLSDGNNQVIIDLAKSHRLGDIVETLNGKTLGDREISATLDGNQIRIDFTDGLGGTLRIANVGGGRLASDLGIETVVAAPGLPIVGRDLQPVLTRNTGLDQLLGGAGFDLSGSIKITQGNRDYAIDLTGSQTIEDVLIKINNSGAGVRADISTDGRRLQIKSALSGVDFSISEVSGNLASRLGLKTFHGNIRLDDLNHGQGIYRGEGDDLEITRTDGTAFKISLAGAITVNDAIAIINNHVDNQDPALKITAAVNNSGNGLVFSTPLSGLPDEKFVIGNVGGSQAATGLGLIPPGEAEAIGSSDGTNFTITGKDSNPQEVDGLFNTLLRLRNAIRDNDQSAFARISTALDDDANRVTAVRGRIGVDQQQIESLQYSNEDQILKATERQSEILDTDFASAVAELNSRQAAYEASLRLLAALNSTSLFNYL